MKRTIGIPGYLTETSFGAGKTHLYFIQQYGDPVIIMPHEEFKKVDMLYLPGGSDLSPSSYGEVPSFYTSNHDVFKEFFFKERLKNYVENKVPIFGVCLGFQMLHAHFGGKLEQHLMYHPQSPSRREAGHKVRLLNVNLKVDKPFDVNSHHHQGILESQIVGDKFDVLAVENMDDGFDRVVEAFRHKELPIAGVQWHPEEWYDSYSSKLIKSILKEF